MAAAASGILPEGTSLVAGCRTAKASPTSPSPSARLMACICGVWPLWQGGRGGEPRHRKARPQGMTRAGERVKGATSARPFRGRQGGGPASQPPRRETGTQPQKAGRAILRKVFQARGRGGSKVCNRPRLETAAPLIGRLFSQSWRISERPARVAATPSMAGQSDAPLSNGMRADRADLFASAAIPPWAWVLLGDPLYTGAGGAANARAARFSHPRFCCFGFGLASLGQWRERQKAMGTVGTVGTLSLSHRNGWPFARSGLFPLAISRVGTVGTAKGERRGRKIRALVASPARAHRSGGAEL